MHLLPNLQGFGFQSQKVDFKRRFSTNDLIQTDLIILRGEEAKQKSSKKPFSTFL